MPARVSDAVALSSLVADNMSHLGHFMPKVVRLNTLEAAQRYLQSVVESNGEGELLEWHIFDGDTLCGAIRLNHIEPENRKVSIGYYIGAGFQGQGLATMSIRAVLRFVFEGLGFNRVQLKCASINLPSQRVAERLGFSWEGLLRQAEMIDGQYVDHFVYGLLREEFEARNPAGMRQAA
jgi:ribosomal-protein-serine acetyltransferase